MGKGDYTYLKMIISLQVFQYLGPKNNEIQSVLCSSLLFSCVRKLFQQFFLPQGCYRLLALSILSSISFVQHCMPLCPFLCFFFLESGGRISPSISNVDDALSGKVGFEKSSLNLSELSPRLCVYLEQQPDTVGKLHATFGDGGRRKNSAI